MGVLVIAYNKNPDTKHTCTCIHALPGHHNQLSEMVPPAQFFSTMGHFTSMNATSVFMLNLSDLRPVVMSVDYIMQYLWNPSKWNGYTPQAFQASAWVGGCSRMSLRCERGTYVAHCRCTCVFVAVMQGCVDLALGESCWVGGTVGESQRWFHRFLIVRFVFHCYCRMRSWLTGPSACSPPTAVGAVPTSRRPPWLLCMTPTSPFPTTTPPPTASGSSTSTRCVRGYLGTSVLHAHSLRLLRVVIGILIVG